MAFKLQIDKRALKDIDTAIEFYFEKSPNTAKKPFNQIQKAYLQLESNPFFQIRYKDYRCLLIKNFPFMFHFTVDERSNTVRIYAMIHTSQNPKKKWL